MALHSAVTAGFICIALNPVHYDMNFATCCRWNSLNILLLLSVHLYSALSSQIPNALHALCQYDTIRYDRRD